MAEQEHDKLADELERQTDRLKRGSDELERQVDDARQDWERKRRDESIPGAPPPAGEDAEREGEPEDPGPAETE